MFTYEKRIRALQLYEQSKYTALRKSGSPPNKAGGNTTDYKKEACVSSYQGEMMPAVLNIIQRAFHADCPNDIIKCMTVHS